MTLMVLSMLKGLIALLLISSALLSADIDDDRCVEWYTDFDGIEACAEYYSEQDEEEEEDEERYEDEDN